MTRGTDPRFAEIHVRPWKKAGMSRAKYERLIMTEPQEYLDEISLSVEADFFVESIFGEELAEELDSLVLETVIGFVHNTKTARSLGWQSILHPLHLRSRPQSLRRRK